jgi:5-methylcytosine-specific restriction endonuclease McrA
LSVKKYRSSERCKEKLRHALRKFDQTEHGRLSRQQSVRRRREQKKNLDMSYSLADERVTRTLFNNQCFHCGAKEYLQIDHHYPLSRGFGLKISNAVLLCCSCNASKHDKLPNEFYSIEQLNTLSLILQLV